MQLIWINEMVVLKKALIPLAVRILPQLEVWVRFCIMYLTIVQECQSVLQLPDLLLPGVLAVCLRAAS